MDDIDDRPVKRRKIDRPDPVAPMMQLRSSRSFCRSETPRLEEDSVPAKPQVCLRRTRSSPNTAALSELSSSQPSKEFSSSAGRRSLPDLELSSSQSSAGSSARPSRSSLPNAPPTSSQSSTADSSRTSLPSAPPTSSQSSMASTAGSSRTSLPNLKGKDLFDSLIWSDPLTTSIFYTFVTSLRETIRRDVTETTVTHKFIKGLRDAGRLVRNYTQNIDMLEEREGLCTELEKGPGDRSRFSQKVQKAMDQATLPGDSGISCSSGSLPEGDQSSGTSRTPESYPRGVESVYLHGSLGSLRCGLCSRLSSWDEDGRTETTLAGDAPDCPWCTASSSHREGRGRRSLAIGRLRPDIVLYGEEHPAAHLISPLITHDLSLGPDILLILGTSLRVHGLKVMVREFAKAVHGRGGKVIFINQTKPPDSIWGDIIDYHVQWDCDKWVEDLKERRSDVWLPIISGERKAKDEKPKSAAKNPVATRPDTSSGAYFHWKIGNQLGRLSGRLSDIADCIVANREESSVIATEGSGKRKRNSLPRPNAVRDNKENGAYMTWNIGRNLRRLSSGLTTFVANDPKSPLKPISANIPGRRRASGKKGSQSAPNDESQLPTPPNSDANSDQDATPPYTPRTRRTKRLCGISALLSSPTRDEISEDTIRVYRDESWRSQVE